MFRFFGISLRVLLITISFGFAGCLSSSQAFSGASNYACPNSVAQMTPKNYGQYKPFSSFGLAARVKKLSGHVPSLITSATDQGQVDSHQTLPLTFALELNHEDELKQFLEDVYNPKSPNFRKFITPKEFLARYAPTEDQLSEVKAYLLSNGIQVNSQSENRMILHASAQVDQVNSLFNTEIHQYVGPQGQAFFAPAYELQIPANLSVRAVHGLNNSNRWHAHFVRNENQTQQGLSPRGTVNGLSPTAIKSFYNIPSQMNGVNLDGSGQTLALVELDGYTSSDITTYEDYFGLPNVPIQNIMVDDASGDAGQGAMEVTLDIELMIALAPNASQILVYEGPNSAQGVLDIYSKIASDNQAQVISTSWGAGEDQVDSSMFQTENKIFMQMAAQGQTIYAASGDSGAYTDGSKLSVDDPAAQPYVVGVGGTHISTNANYSYGSETTWNTNNTPSGGSSGGGISTVWPIPSWQKNVISPKSLGSTTMRNVPDVSLDADPSTGYAVFYNGQWGTVGGTSCAAPLWAAYTALVNEGRAQKGLSTLGFPNPVFYQIGQSNHYSLDFHDIADGSTNIYYPAVPGYNDATGWGTFNGVNLFEDLVTDTPPAAANPPISSPTSPSGNGGGNSTGSQQSCPSV